MLSPAAQMNPQLDLLQGHLFAQGAGQLVGHDTPTRPPYGGHPPPAGEGFGPLYFF
jgi:hypothetical protein